VVTEIPGAYISSPGWGVVWKDTNNNLTQRWAYPSQDTTHDLVVCRVNGKLRGAFRTNGGWAPVPELLNLHMDEATTLDVGFTAGLITPDNTEVRFNSFNMEALPALGCMDGL